MWLPVNRAGATATNGAMRCVTLPHDPLHRRPQHPQHMSTAQTAEAAAGVPGGVATMLCAPGGTCVWDPSVVHWGGSCGPGEASPRISVAATFRADGAAHSAFGGVAPAAASGAATGPPPLQLRALLRGGGGKCGGGGGGGGESEGDCEAAVVPLARRLAHVAKALIAFSHWYPGFPGLDLVRLQSGASAELLPASAAVEVQEQALRVVGGGAEAADADGQQQQQQQQQQQVGAAAAARALQLEQEDPDASVVVLLRQLSPSLAPDVVPLLDEAALIMSLRAFRFPGRAVAADMVGDALGAGREAEAARIVEAVFGPDGSARVVYAAPPYAAMEPTPDETFDGDDAAQVCGMFDGIGTSSGDESDARDC